MDTLESRLGDWWPYLKDEFAKPYLINMANQIAVLRNLKTVYPLPTEVFSAFKATSPQNTKVVILGQDCYHDGNSTGKAFECKLRKNGRAKDVTPSMDKILEAYDEQFPTSFATDLYIGDLDRWAAEGVLLLNASLTVEEGKPNSHIQIWAPFTKMIISLIASSQKPKVFLFLGREAQKFQYLVKKPHTSIYREHPAAACYGKRRWEHGNCFIEANKFLKETGQEPIDW